MSRIAHASIRARTLAITAVSLTVALVASCVFVFTSERREFMESIAADFSSTAQVVADGLQVAVAFEDAQVANETLGVLRTKPMVRIACAYQKSGQLLASYRTARDGDCPPSAPPIGLARQGTILTISQPVIVQGAHQGSVLLRRDLTDLRGQLRRQAAVLVIASLIALLTGILLMDWLQGFISNPISSLAATATRITEERDYSIRAQKGEGAEVEILIDAFNAMVEQIEDRTRQLQETMKREVELSRLKDEFLATLSHELRTPLNAILGWSHMLREPGFDPERVEHGLGVIERNALAQARLVEDLLDVSRVIAGKLKIETRPVHLAEVLRSALEVVRPTADAKQIRVQVVDGGGSDLVLGDEGRLQQMIWNLLANAVKYTPSGGAVFATIIGRPDGVELEVADTGEGIEPAFLPHAFELFRQGERAVVLARGGLGLGLSLVQRIAEMHGGRAELRSPGKGHGTTATVKLPHYVESAGALDGRLLAEGARSLPS